MAYKTRGNGNIAPRREVDRAKTAPTVTAHMTAGQPNWENTYGKGASGS